MDIDKIFTDLKENFPNLEIYQNHPLASYTTVKIGGPADIFIHSKNSDDFLNLLKYLSQQSLPFTVLGNGSNTLISDSGIRGLVIKNDSQQINKISDHQLEIISSTQLSHTINFCLENNLLGLEEFAYIPSTIGGAIYGNIHGTKKHNFSNFIESVKVFDTNLKEIKILKSQDLDWDYDYSSFQDQANLIILSAVLKLNPGDPSQAKQEFQDIVKEKTSSQPLNSLGSVFKNIPNQPPIGHIIDKQLKLKAHSIGDAQISPNHANFIINKGKATAKDYYHLIQLIQSKAQKELNLNFELEIKLLGQF
jgi:UDP-N-acetylmuramate dehydrogenase